MEVPSFLCTFSSSLAKCSGAGLDLNQKSKCVAVKPKNCADITNQSQHSFLSSSHKSSKSFSSQYSNLPPFKEWFIDQKHQHHLGACKTKCRVSGSIPDQINQNLHFSKILRDVPAYQGMTAPSNQQHGADLVQMVEPPDHPWPATL